MRRALTLAIPLLLGAAPLPPAGADYQPQDADERGLWAQVDEAERAYRTSNFVIRDPALNAYVRGVFCRLAPADCARVRIYLVRTPWFNASMAPTGMMEIWSGLFLRTRDEAQLAAVIGHEYTHYRLRHTLRLFRDVKAKTNAMAWLSLIPVGGYAAAAGMTAMQVGVIGSIYGFSRDMEREADAGSLPLLARAGYDPRAASRIWGEIRAEEAATAAERKRRKRGEGGMFATHPSSAERQATLEHDAAALASPAAADLGADRYRAALAPWQAALIDDQIKLNDFGATEWLLRELANGHWTGDLLYARGELYRSRGGAGDFAAAAGYYRDAVASGGAPVEAWRGLGLALLRSGDGPGGRAALKSYLAEAPGAKDRAMMMSLAGMAS